MGALEPDPQFVPLRVLPVRVGRRPDVEMRLTDPTVSRLHAVIELQDGSPLVRDLESSSGTFVNGQQIKERRLNVEDRVRFGKVVTYRLREEGLEKVAQEAVELRLRGLEIAVKDRVLVSFGQWQWSLLPGQLGGILGPSGSGKTMLLRTIAGVRRPSWGIISCGSLADVWQHIDAHRRRLAYIPQDDVIYPLLTVKENLLFAAQLRLGQQKLQDETEQRVGRALEFFGLGAHADKLARVLSGGQRKRVSVALEWLREPELFLLDEPTAGLDPANEARLMENLKELARRGATVVCTTHLMEHIYLLDQVLVLGIHDRRGVPAYAGDPAGLLPDLQCRNFADLYEKLEQGDFQPLASHEAAAAETDEELSAGQAAAVQAERPSGSTGTGRSLRELAIPPEKEVDPVSIRVVGQRTWLGLWRDRWMRWMLLGQPAILAAVVVLTQFSPGRIFGMLFFTTVVACWLGMNNSIRDLVRDRRGYIRDRLSGLAPGSYLVAKWLVYAAIGASQLLIFLLLIRLFVPLVLPENLKEELLERTVLGWLGWWGALWLVYLGGLGLSLIVSTLVESEEAAVAWLPILIMPQILLSAMATGSSPLKYTDPRPFRPLVITLAHPFTEAKPAEEGETPERLPTIALLVDALSLALVCRPGVLVIEHPSVKDFGTHLWLGDLCHLVILIVGFMLILWFVFLRQERYWPSLVGY